MKKLGNLAMVCAQRTDVLLQILNGRATVHIGYGPDRAALAVGWNDDEGISQIIHELNFGKFQKRGVSMNATEAWNG